MEALTKRIQILLSEEQYGLLKRLAAAKHTSVGALVREAVEAVYLEDLKDKRVKIAQRLVEMELPVADWLEMEEEITRGATEER
jgi:predicted DNA-binding protein